MPDFANENTLHQVKPEFQIHNGSFYKYVPSVEWGVLILKFYFILDFNKGILVLVYIPCTICNILTLKIISFCTKKRIHCVSEIQISLGILYFSLLVVEILFPEQLEKGSVHFGCVRTWGR